jgi:hypothetical protein
METKQTAVEYLQRVYFKTGMLYRTDFEKAKQMEREQTLDFTRNAVRKILDEDRQNPFNLEQYYNETYGGQDE